MSEHSSGDKTEQPTGRRLEEALKRGQIARSPEIQTVFVFFAGLAALSFAGKEIWYRLAGAMQGSLGHLHDTTLTSSALQGYAVSGTFLLFQCVGPIVLATALAGLLAGTIQNRFNIASEALSPNWERLNPVAGFQRLFSMRMVAPTAMSIAKLAFIIALVYSEVQSILSDPIFTTSVSVARLAEFLASTWMRLFFRVGLVLLVIAAADYGYQWWRTHQDLMMTKQEVKDEAKNTEGNQQVKAARRNRHRAMGKAKMLAEVPKADVVVTNPTHIAIALRYDRKNMRAPKIVAKGIRLNAQRIRELAQQHQVPILENKPLARMLFKHGKVGGEIPAQFYAAVAEVLAWVYRVNRYRYYTEQNQV
ncbi:MAG TPA: EscU/YscU/HrcU family type III secretion system export apparatus switch protein [Candidatus Sulfotelmatobacter sp.]|nr:EscU/YscU/HrcU family type III secretion system export apparatus switch protein [Candidatus Sulfotelmatobacter sp.]HWI60033.1 EscU/YscU/HrcU family type III secretion system export apparatus switch protein [Bacillota bacterium]